jgi:hypothetical protein
MTDLVSQYTGPHEAGADLNERGARPRVASMAQASEALINGGRLRRRRANLI